MVTPIYLVSLTERVGKSLVTVGLLKKLQKEGKKVAYFKPIGISKGALTAKQDADIGFIVNTVYDTNLPYDIICPISIPETFYIDSIDAEKAKLCLDKIKNAYAEATKDADYVIIEGNPSIIRFVRVGLDDVSIAQALGIEQCVLMVADSSDMCVDKLLFTKRYFDFRHMGIKGIILNMIDFDYVARIEELKEDHILKYVPIIGIIEKSVDLLSARVSEVQAAIGGELLNDAASEGLDNMVQSYVIGAMKTQAALKYLRQVKNFALITGGDRADLAMAALNEGISCLILTGFIQPDISVITAANEKNIPLILSPSDTYTTMRNISRLKPGIQPDEIDEVAKLIEKDLNWDLLK